MSSCNGSEIAVLSSCCWLQYEEATDVANNTDEETVLECYETNFDNEQYYDEYMIFGAMLQSKC